MAYVQRSDYSRVIGNNDLRELLEEANQYFQGKAENTVLSEAGAMSEAKIGMYLDSIYDTVTEFAIDGTLIPDTREQNILRIYLHITVYNLNYVINPRDIPELRKMAYDNAISELERIKDGELVIGLNKVTDAPSRLNVFDGHTKFISKPYSDPQNIA